jgi:hypothetical protein
MPPCGLLGTKPDYPGCPGKPFQPKRKRAKNMTGRSAALFTWWNLRLSLVLILAILAHGCTSGPEAIQPVRMAVGGEITLSWQPVAGATAYNVYFSTTPGVTKLNGVKIANAANPITLRDLQRGSTYYFVVTAVDGEERESAESAEISRRVD